MNGETALVVLESDLSMLIAAASRIQQRLRAWPTAYIATCVSICSLIVAAANLASETNTAKFIEIFQMNRNFLGVASVGLCLIGVMQILSFARDRKHYIRIINALNSMRKNSCAALNIEGAYSLLWTDKIISPWPIDSATTFSYSSLLCVTLFFLVTALVAFGFSNTAVATATILSFITIMWLTYKVSV